jgi:TetR/AcrR family transcriptional regulator, lmrAB and yxaGH operons repressor
MSANVRERMLQATTQHVQHQGYHGANLREILRDAEAPRGSVYFHFPRGKDQMVLEAVQAHIAQVDAAFQEVAEAHPGAPGAALQAYFEGAAHDLEASGFLRGCPVTPVLMDAVPEPSKLHQLCVDTLARWEEEWAALVQGSGVPKARARAWGVRILAALEGGLLLARARRDGAALRVLGAELRRALEEEFPPGKRKR